MATDGVLERWLTNLYGKHLPSTDSPPTMTNPLTDRIIPLLESLAARVARLEALREAEFTSAAAARINAITADRGRAVNPFAIMTDQFKAEGRPIFKPTPAGGGEPLEPEAVEALAQSEGGQQAEQQARAAWIEPSGPPTPERAAAALEVAPPGTNSGLALVGAAVVAGLAVSELLAAQRRMAERLEPGGAGLATAAELRTPEARAAIDDYLAAVPAADRDHAMGLLMLAWHRTANLARAIRAATDELGRP